MVKEQCENKCINTQALKVKNSPEEICQKKKETGFCKAHLTRYYHNSSTKSCEQFVYGGKINIEILNNHADFKHTNSRLWRQ